MDRPRELGRVDSLESIRGLAALCVLFSHLALTFFPFLHAPRASGIAGVVVNTPLRVVYDGSFAVRVFFVLSGFVLSIAYFQRPSQERLAGATVRRYFRLTLPIVASVMLAYLLLCAGAFANQPAAKVLGPATEWWLALWYRSAPNLRDALMEGTYGVYFGFDQAKTYNGVLWTMGIELFGSLFVFACLALVGPLRRRWVIYLILGVLMYHPWRVYLDFLAGIAVCDALVHRDRIHRPVRLGILAGTGLLVAGLCLGGIQASVFKGAIAAFVQASRVDLQTLGAVLVISAVVCSPFWGAFLEWKPFVFLGRISFSLYLLHLLIICSLGCQLFLLLHLGLAWPIRLASGASFAAVTLASLLASWVMYRLIDQRAIALGKWVYSFFGPEPLEKKQGGELKIAA